MQSNDDGTDTQIGTVVVHIVEQIPIQGSRLDIAGTVSKNAGVGAIPQVINSKTGETADCRIAVTYNTANGHVTHEIPLSVGMLTDSTGKPVDTSVDRRLQRPDHHLSGCCAERQIYADCHR